MNFLKWTIFLGLILAAIGWLFFVWNDRTSRSDSGVIAEQSLDFPPAGEVDRTVSPEAGAPATETAPPVKVVEPKIWPMVGFISQAPTGEWGKSEFQNGCEEASVLMVDAWLTGKIYTKDEAKRELVAMARYQEKRIGQAIDTDAETTAEILLEGYFEIVDYQLVYDFTLDELKRATAEGLVIVPTNGRALSNPNFTLPGPLEHMLVVTGYDIATREFITNDPGTRKGEGYRYPEATLYAAIREYPTGKHLTIQTERKAMIVVPASTNP